LQKTKNEGVSVQSVARVLDIIKCFENANELGISELSERMDLAKSTIYGLVHTLAAYGYLEQSEQNKKYRLGLKLFELGNLVHGRIDIRWEAKPWCQMLFDKYKTTVHLAAYSEGDVVYIDKVDNESSLVNYSRVGKRGPMYCTGVGKAILAYLPMEYLKKYVLTKPFQKLTDNTITTREGLLEELEQVRSKGYAIDNEEIEAGLQCIAAPIFNHQHNPQMALSVSFPLGRLQNLDIDEVARDVLYYSAQISERLGYIA